MYDRKIDSIFNCSYCGADACIFEGEPDKIYRISTPRILIHETCENCGAEPAEQYDVIDPKFVRET